ncbi:MAG: hypothetical protein FWC70_10835 [Defluviitaleaceae bacterium]|nr:hypothetical protein [Defluviitaleaceae bacterium]
MTATAKARREPCPEERRIRKRMIDMNVKQRDIALAVGLFPTDVCKVITQTSKTPSYKRDVYNFLGLEMPNESEESA